MPAPIDPKKEEHIMLLYTQYENYSKVAKQVGVAVNTVRNVIKRAKKGKKNANRLQEYENIKKNEQKEILELVKSTKYSNIANNIVDLFNKESLENELERYGIKNLISLLGNSIDKTIKVQELELHKEKVALQTRTLELKERELEARLEKPEAFGNVTIINDADDEYGKYRKSHTN